MSNAQVTYYELLEVTSNATDEEISSAYKRKRRDAHPDRGGSAALWRLYQEAADTLLDAGRRAAYDQSLNGGAPKPRPSASRTGKAPRQEYTAPQQTPYAMTGPAQTYFPVPGQPPAADDPRLQTVNKRGALRKIGMGLWWALAVIALLWCVFAGVATALDEYETIGGGISAFISNVVFLGPVFVMPQVIVAYKRRTARKQVEAFNEKIAEADRSLDQAIDAERSARRIWGTPGAVSEARFGDAAAAGNLGELATARDLETWFAAVPAARILHGVRWPGTSHADIDHVVVVGNRAAVIDSKYWAAGDYWWDGARLFARGVERDPLKSDVAAAALARIVTQPLQVRAWVVQQNPAARVENESATLPLVTPAQLAVALEEWLVTSNPHAGVVDRRILLNLVSQLKG